MKSLLAVVSCMAFLVAGCVDDHSPPRGRADRPDLKGSATGSGGATEPEKENAPSSPNPTESTDEGDRKNYRD